MKRLEKFLVMMSVLSLALFHFGDKKSAGILLISLSAMALFYFAGSYFLFTWKMGAGAIERITAMLAGVVLSYGVASLLMLTMGKMTPAAARINNGLFLGVMMLCTAVDYAMSKRQLSKMLLIRAGLLLIVLSALSIFSDYSL